MTDPAETDGRRIDVLLVLFSFHVGGKERVITDVLTARKGSSVNYGVVIINDGFNEALLRELRATGACVFLLGRRGDRCL